MYHAILYQLYSQEKSNCWLQPKMSRPRLCVEKSGKTPWNFRRQSISKGAASTGRRRARTKKVKSWQIALQQFYQISASTELLTPEQLANLCASASFNPHFYNSPPAPMDAHTVAKFD